MNFARITIFTLFLIMLQVAAHFVTYLMFGNMKTLGSVTYFLNLYLPSVAVTIFVLSILAQRQNDKVYTHLLIVSILSALVIIGSSTALIGEYILSPFWYVDLALSIASVFISVKIGRYLMDRKIVTPT